MTKKRLSEERDKLAASLAAALPDSGGAYQASSAFSASELKRFHGIWYVSEHTVGASPFIDGFAATALRGAALLEPAYAAVYDFRESICVKRVTIRAHVNLNGERTEYAYKMSMALSWNLSPGYLIVRPELGYQSVSLGGESAGVKEFVAIADAVRIRYHFEGEALALEEGADVKRLERSSI